MSDVRQSAVCDFLKTIGVDPHNSFHTVIDITPMKVSVTSERFVDKDEPVLNADNSGLATATTVFVVDHDLWT